MPAAQKARDPELELAEAVASFTHDPLGFVLFAYPWGEGELEGETGPDEWQREHLESVGQALREGADVQTAIRQATSSGHGVGKSALVAWLGQWAMSTHEDTRGWVTAGTDTQLRTKTVPEFAKWFRMLICRRWFRFTRTAMFSAQSDHADTWRLDFTPWNETRPESVAGLHNKGKRIFVLFDEASQIAEIIWDTIEGALTDANTEIIWCVFGNPTRNTGRFRECWGKHRDIWKTRKVDSRTAKAANKGQIQQWVDSYGEDSDFVRVRVRGEFPRAAATQFISSELAEQAQKRKVEATAHDPIVLGVDVARFGDDQSVLAPRRGRDARSLPWKRFRGIDTMQLAGHAVSYAQEIGARAIFIDGGGLGAGVVDRCRQLAPSGIQIHDVQFGGEPDGAWVDWFGREKEKCRNKRAEMWALMRAWLAVGAIPSDNEVYDDLIGVEYGYGADNDIVLEKKEDMKKRGLASPDNGDALALTFAQPVSDRFAPRGGSSQPKSWMSL